MHNISNSAQVKYSLDCLSEALFHLMQNDRYQDISITEICQHAHITRTTFYRNCDSKNDLVIYAIKKNVIELLKSVPWSNEIYTPMYQNFFQFWYKRKDFLLTLKKQELFASFYSIFTEVCVKELDLQPYNPMFKEENSEQLTSLYRTSFIIGGLCNMLEKWCENNFETDIPILVGILLERVPAKYTKTQD